VQALDPVGHRPPVREQPTEPAMVDERHADALRLVLDGVLRLLLRPDEQHRAVPLGEIAHVLRGLVEPLARLGQVDDVDAGPLGEDEAAHLRVPATRLVAEVHPGLQQLAHRGDCHRFSFVVWLALLRRGSGRTDSKSRHPRPRQIRRVVGRERGNSSGRPRISRS
jgi:hypothetical protein